jgi:hypothetical protein
LTFTFHVSTHDYYSLQLIPVVALSLGPLAAHALDYARGNGPVAARAAVLLLLLSGALFSAAAQQDMVSGLAEQDKGTAFPGRYVGNAFAVDYEARVSTYEEIGRIVGGGEAILFAPDYSYPLVYHGRFSGDYWLALPWTEPEKPAAESLDAIVAERSPDYFVAVRRFTHYGVEANWGAAENAEIRRLLRARYPVAAKTDEYVVFDLRHKGDPSARRR